MKSLLLILLGLTFCLTAAAQTSNVQPIDGTDCSNLFFKALAEKDAAALSSLVSNDFTAIGMRGQPIQSNQLVQAVSQGIIVIDSGMLSAARTRTYGDVAVTTGLWNVKARIENAGFEGELSYMSVCVKSGGRWKIVAVQFTPI
ncbi:nuclear transport factor 2 family protein [Dyadobacter sp. CY326]|uniref:nuclear transport factor 2 family protein n=1 Tax=Dyadobacter sp. CY326 TaxID=2907300 RepID=UPI001F47525B|nr:nuclear transport factor 2 family protein [Dyadobacter sp. CY326]MCE7068215.1 nuclear transport factor 2 family protein [Dyadobacter sp. CY326]